MIDSTLTFTSLVEKHTKDCLDSRYKAIECMITMCMLQTGCTIWEMELVEERHDNEYCWSIRKKADPRPEKHPTMLVKPTLQGVITSE